MRLVSWNVDFQEDVGASLVSAQLWTEEQLTTNAIGTYYAPDSVEPRQLGGPVQVQPVDGGIDVLPPVWVPTQKPIAHIRCP